jgi:DNA-binding NarL/FixJ family response regulator
VNPFTERQRQVARLLASDASTKQIAHDLGISQHTLTRHISDIYGRAGVQDRVGLVLFLVRKGIVQVEIETQQEAAA